MSFPLVSLSKKERIPAVIPRAPKMYMKPDFVAALTRGASIPAHPRNNVRDSEDCASVDSWHGFCGDEVYVSEGTGRAEIAKKEADVNGHFA